MRSRRLCARSLRGPIIGPVKKELRPVHDNVSCDVCGRTILKGERTEAYLAPGGQRHAVCELCFARAEQEGWIREAAAGDVAQHRFPRPEPRRPLLGRLFRGRRRAAGWPNGGEADAGGGGSDPPPDDDAAPSASAEPEAWREVVAEPDPPPAPEPPPAPRSMPKEPRHVRAVPTTADVKVERALELINASDHQRTIAGLARTLGQPWVTAAPDEAAPSMVNVVVAWELSWYWYRVDLGDEADPISLLEKGEELGQIDEGLRAWNAALDADDRLVAGIGSER
jgi:hypothetical protein